jgi:uncharacterized membrane protein
MRGLVLCLSAAVGLGALARADEPAKKYQVIAPRGEGIVATGINERGDIVGFEEIEDKKRPGVMDQVPFYARGPERTYLPLLKGYTATFPAAVSDDGLVVGHVSKPLKLGAAVPLVIQAFLWDARTGIRGLGVMEGDLSSIATGISRDGRRISGYSVGPDRKRACVWERDGESWKGVVLPNVGVLGSTTVPISGDGRFVAGVDAAVACLWSRDASGAWTREAIEGAAALVPRAVNNAGTVIGVRYTPDGMTHAVVWSRSGGLRRLPEPTGYVKSEALAINNAGVVVGMIDGPAGSPIGPNAFVSEGGRLRILAEGGPNLGSATAINDRGQVAGVLEPKEEPVPPAGAARKEGPK